MLILKADHIHFAYNASPVIRDVSFGIEKGDFLGLIGPNGAGKTTLLKLIDGVLLPTEGAIRLFGKPVGEIKRIDLAKIVAVVPQISPMIFSLTAQEVVLMGRTPHLGRWRFEGEEDHAIVRRVMEKTETLQLAGRNMNQLSGGETHRVLIARALAQEPQILLLDEPTAFLDIRHQVDFLNLVQRLNEEQGMTVIAVTHDINLASLYCKQIALLKEGQIQALGSPEEVITEERIEAAYHLSVTVDHHPVTGRPRVTPGREEPSDNGNRLKPVLPRNCERNETRKNH